MPQSASFFALFGCRFCDYSILSDRLLGVGDCTTGPQQEEVLTHLRELNAILIQGNSEKWLCDFDKHILSDYFYAIHQYDLGRWAYQHLGQDTLAYLHSLPEQAVFSLPGSDSIRMVHGSPRRVDEGLWPENRDGQLTNIISLISEPVMVCGHTHQPWQVKINGQFVLNPGAVCSPLNGKVGAQYALLEWTGTEWRATLRCVPYDLNEIRQIFIDTSILECSCLSRTYLSGILTGHDATRDFITHARKIALQEGAANLPYLPDSIWELAEKTFAWRNWPL